MNESTAKTSKNQPAHEIRVGCIKAVIWANKVGDDGVIHNVVLLRIYRDDSGEWRETHSIGRDDLLLAAKILDSVHTWICERERK